MIINIIKQAKEYSCKCESEARFSLVSIHMQQFIGNFSTEMHILLKCNVLGNNSHRTKCWVCKTFWALWGTKVARKVNPKSSMTRKILKLCVAMDVNYVYCGNHFAICPCTESLCCTPEINVMSITLNLKWLHFVNSKLTFWNTKTKICQMRRGKETFSCNE